MSPRSFRVHLRTARSTRLYPLRNQKSPQSTIQSIQQIHQTSRILNLNGTMFQYSNLKCGDCNRAFCFAIDADEAEADVPVCPHCDSKSVMPAADAGVSVQAIAQLGGAAPRGMFQLLAAVRNLNNPRDCPRVSDGCGLPSTWFSQEELHALAQLKLDRKASVVSHQTIEWSELEVRQLLFLKGILCKSCVDVGEELGVGVNRVAMKYKNLCVNYGLVDKEGKVSS